MKKFISFTYIVGHFEKKNHPKTSEFYVTFFIDEMVTDSTQNWTD